MNSSAKQPDYMVLINEENRLPDNFEDTIELVTAENIVGKKFEIEKKAYEALSIDTAKIDRICLRCNNKGVRYSHV